MGVLMTLIRISNSHVALILLVIVVLWTVWIAQTSFFGLFSHPFQNWTEKSNTDVIIANAAKGYNEATFYENVTIRSNDTIISNQLDFEEQYKLNLAGLDLYRYQWTILERDFCSRRYPNLFVLIIVHTAVPHLKRRQAIREMWGNVRLYDKYKTAVIFALGETTDETIRRMVKQESARYRDIIQQNFLDAYKLLVLKGLMWIRFVAEYCPKVPFILKLDDDVAVNYIGVLQFLTTLIRRKLFPPKRLTMCYIISGSRVYRNKDSKWYVSKAEYSDDFFPRYCGGLAFILTSDLIRPMMEEAQKAKLIWIDDFFLTGYLTANANVTFGDIGSLYEMDSTRVEKSMSRGVKLFGTVSSVNQHKRVWKKLSRQYQWDNTRP